MAVTSARTSPAQPDPCTRQRWCKAGMGKMEEHTTDTFPWQGKNPKKVSAAALGGVLCWDVLLFTLVRCDGQLQHYQEL